MEIIGLNQIKTDGTNNEQRYKNVYGENASNGQFKFNAIHK